MMAASDSTDSVHQDDAPTVEVAPLSDAQRAKIERNRQKALLIKQKKQESKPYTLRRNTKEKEKFVPKVVDTGAGFLLEDEEIIEDRHKPIKVTEEPGAVVEGDMLVCEECGRQFMDSYLYSQFSCLACDRCRDNDDKHQLITRSDAKNTYLLKDADLDKREPELRFILRKNPHNSHWGDMKLYLHKQVSARALEVWGSEEGLEEARENRQANRVKLQQSKYNKKVKELRKAVRSSLWKKDTSSHEHVYGEESYNEDDDNYSKTCSTCGHEMNYEKM